jgi:hypothetical protein
MFDESMFQRFTTMKNGSSDSRHFSHRRQSGRELILALVFINSVVGIFGSVALTWLKRQWFSFGSNQRLPGCTSITDFRKQSFFKRCISSSGLLWAIVMWKSFSESEGWSWVILPFNAGCSSSHLWSRRTWISESAVSAIVGEWMRPTLKWEGRTGISIGLLTSIETRLISYLPNVEWKAQHRSFSISRLEITVRS